MLIPELELYSLEIVGCKIFGIIFTTYTLEDLNLSNNNITNFPRDIKKLKNLKYLHIHMNRIQKLPKFINKLPIIFMQVDEEVDISKITRPYVVNKYDKGTMHLEFSNTFCNIL